MISSFESISDSDLQPAQYVQGAERLLVHVIPTLGNGVILTGEDGIIMHGNRNITTSLEQDAIRIADKNYGLRSTKGAGPLLHENTVILSGRGFVIEPTLEARDLDFIELGLERHDINALYDRHRKLATAALSAASFATAARQQALLHSFRNFQIEHKRYGY